MIQTKKTDTPPLYSNIFEERAENLSKQELMAWSVETAQDRHILNKLQTHGTKLLSGPRGSGKSTLLRKAYYNLLEAGKILPAYVNYSQSLALEPLFHNHVNALQIFQKWVLFKIVEGIYNAFEEARKNIPENLRKYAYAAMTFICELEQRNVPYLEEKIITTPELLVIIEQWNDENGFEGCVLLLDDATHAFSSVQQHAFFEIFRSLKSRAVSAKAAIYPGITSDYPPFLIGHDAELIEVWYQPEEEGYLEIMKEVLKRRLPQESMESLVKKRELIDYLALAAFGLPRSFLLMISQLLGIEEHLPKKPSRSLARKIITTHCSIIHGEFQSLLAKWPQYSRFIEMGGKLENAMVSHLKRYNQSRSTAQKAVVVGIAEPIEPALSKILALLEYTGIIRSMGAIHRGNKRFYCKYALHYGINIDENTLSLEGNYALSTLITALTKRDHQAITLAKDIGLLGRDFKQQCTLNLLPCQNCGALPVFEEAKFCVECGRRLLKLSIYEELLKSPIDKLPLPKKKIGALRRQTSIRTVQDILLDKENKKIMQINRLGKIWANRIHNAAQEFVSA